MLNSLLLAHTTGLLQVVISGEGLEELTRREIKTQSFLSLGRTSSLFV